MGFISEAAREFAQKQDLATREASARERTQSLAEALVDSRSDVTDLRETINELQLAIEDIGWLNANWSLGQLEFSRTQIIEIVRFSRLMWLKNPLINRAVNLQALYVWGQGVEVKSPDPDTQAALESFWDNPRNVVELSGHQARTMKEVDLEVTGNLFFVLFTDAMGDTVVRSIPVEEIEQIISDPEDRKTTRYYKRAWNSETLNLQDGSIAQQSQVAYYPDVDYISTDQETMINGQEIRWESPVLHVRVGCMSDMRYGIPEVYQGLEWARIYKNFLEDCATLMRKLAKYSFSMTVKGGQKAVAAGKAKLASTIDSSNPIETNPSALPGSTLVKSQGVELEAIKTSGLAMSPEEGRQIRIMVGAATGTPDVMLSGDADVGNHATAKTLDRPTELKYKDRQTLWNQVIVRITTYAVEHKLRTAKADRSLHVVNAKPVQIEVTFPPILHHDPNETMTALVSAVTLAGNPDANILPREDITRQVCSILGIENIEDLLKRLEQQIADDEARAELEQQFAPEEPADAPPGDKPPTDRAQLAAALRELRERLVPLVEGDGGWVTMPDGRHIMIGGETSGKAALARAHYKPSTAAKQQIADKSEQQISKGLGLPRTKDNSAFDLRTNKVGVEVKTLVDNKNDKITMHPESRARKLAEAAKDKLRMYTVVADKRGASTKYYYSAGIGSFRIGSMQTAKSLADLKTKII